ncbi:MAG TPA: acyltransferase [Planctomycetota bacterium]|nr:acyltransferase [Planctomycetota bacterium]
MGKARASAYLNVLMRMLALPGMSRLGLVTRLLRHGLGVPASTSINPGFHCHAGNIHCGEGVDLSDTLFIDYAPVYIGDGTWFSYRNMVITAARDYEKVTARPVVLERNVWVTSNVTILPGVRIGENSVIGAGSVVVRDIPPNVLAAGNPCRPIRAVQRTRPKRSRPGS